MISCVEGDCTQPHFVSKEGLESTALIVDGMACLQSLPKASLPSTFADLAEHLLRNLVAMGKQHSSIRVDFVCDRYFDTSIKSGERERRSKGDSQVISLYSGSQRLPKQWESYLRSGKNKEALLHFLVTSWKHAELAEEFVLYVTDKEECVRMHYTPGNTPTVKTCHTFSLIMRKQILAFFSMLQTHRRNAIRWSLSLQIQTSSL